MDLDLNLLRVFDMLMELRSVTRAADRLGITQSAVSHALGRLRTALDDPLFVRSPQGLQPTARAIDMAAGVREGLARLRETLAPTRFERTDTHRRFTLAASSYFCALLIPSLIGRVRDEAPGVSLRIVSVSDHLVAALDAGGVDLAFGGYARVPGRFVLEPLFEDELVWVAAPDNPVTAGPFDPEMLQRRPRVAIDARAASEASNSSENDRLVPTYAPALGAEEETTLVYDSLTALAIVAATDLVARVPRRIAERSRDRVTVLGPAGDRFPSIGMIWHARHRADPGLAWLRGIIHSLG